MIGRALDQLLKLPCIGDIGGNGQRAHLPADTVAIVRIFAGDHHLRALILKGAGYRQANAAR